jgi:hypothetical protein
MCQEQTIEPLYLLHSLKINRAMKKLTQQEAIDKLKEVCEAHTRERPDNAAALITAENENERYPTILCKRIGYKLFGKIQSVINRSDNEWHIRAEDNQVLIIIRFFR